MAGASELSSRYNPFVPPQRDDPYPIWAEARRLAPVFWSEPQGVWVVTRHADICAIVRDTDRFSSSDAIRPTREPPDAVRAVLAEGYSYEELRPLLATDPPGHTRLRKLLGAAFTPRIVTELEPRILELATSLASAMVASGQGDLVSTFAYPLPLAVIIELIGVPTDDREDVKRWSDDKVALQWGDLELDRHLMHARGYVEFQRYLTALVEERRRRPASDLISALLSARVEDERPLETHEIVGQLMGLISAGHETTTNLILHVVLLLLRHDLWEEVAADGGLAAAAVEETLRFDSPVMGMMRTATCDVDVGGVRIPSGSRVQLMYGSANRDGAAFDDPDRFDLHRPQVSHHLAFGRGAHFCLGAALGRLEARVALEVLTHTLRDVVIVDPPTFRPNAAFRGPVELRARWSRRGS